MTVTDLIDWLRNVERTGDGDAAIVFDGTAIVDAVYDQATNTVLLTSQCIVDPMDDPANWGLEETDGEAEDSYLEDWDA